MTGPFPSHGRIAGIDYGTVRIGVAITDPDRTLASPCENYTRRDKTADAKWFQQLAADERLVGFVVGLPIHTSGDESQKSREARQFGQWLHDLTGLPIQFYDERYTSVEAEAMLTEAQFTSKQRKARLDKLAAQIMLSAYLDSRGDEGQEPGALED